MSFLQELQPNTLAKAPSGIRGLDQIMAGGLPRGRPTLIAGGAGCGKTLFGMEFIIRGAIEHGEPGVFMSFEENEAELAQNVASLGFDLADLIARNLLAVEFVRVERSEIEETGEYDLEGLFIRLAYAIDRIKAQRLTLDTLEALFAALPNAAILRAELRRLFRWIKDRHVTAVVTAERGDGSLTRHGLEEYVSDCVILLDNRVESQISTRRLRIVKYRGSRHGTNEYPFLIDADGISVLPITALGLDHPAYTERVSSGLPRLDRMLGGRGFYRGSSILITGTPGSGKSSLAAHFVDAACRRGERCIYFAFEESRSQIVRNMQSIGMDLGTWIDAGLLRIFAARPHLEGLEAHLARMHRYIDEFAPAIVVVDPVTSLNDIGSLGQTQAMLVRLIDFLKSQGITALFTSLTENADRSDQREVGISSIMDAWLLLRNIEGNGEHNRGLYILKSRGMSHSNQIREFLLTDDGAQLLDVYAGPDGVLLGAARVACEEQKRFEADARRDAWLNKQRALERKRLAMEAQIEALRAAYANEERELAAIIAAGHAGEAAEQRRRAALASLRGADTLDARDTRHDAGSAGGNDGG